MFVHKSQICTYITLIYVCKKSNARVYREHAHMHASMHAFATYTPLPHPLAASLARTPHLLPDVSAASLANDIISAADVLSCSHPRSYVFLILALTSVYSEFARADMANNVRLEIHLREAYQSIAATRSLLLA